MDLKHAFQQYALISIVHPNNRCCLSRRNKLVYWWDFKTKQVKKVYVEVDEPLIAQRPLELAFNR